MESAGTVKDLPRINVPELSIQRRRIFSGTHDARKNRRPEPTVRFLATRFQFFGINSSNLALNRSRFNPPMAHWSERARRLRLKTVEAASLSELERIPVLNPATYLFQLPFPRSDDDAKRSQPSFEVLSKLCCGLNPGSTICFLTTPEDAAQLLRVLGSVLRFQLWIAVKTHSKAFPRRRGELQRRHAALLIFTRYDSSLKHTKTRIRHTDCPACGKTTKDYGGKTHIYHKYGTSMSDVWRDLEWDPRKGLDLITDRLRDLFGLSPYRDLCVVDLKDFADLKPEKVAEAAFYSQAGERVNVNGARPIRSRLVNRDCVEALRSIPDDSVDFCFADLPYNLNKRYYRSNDDLDTVDYLAWCEEWLSELFRVLRPGCTLAVLNIPSFASHHFAFLSSLMKFRNWIVWDALSLPARKIMPAHYTILCFSKPPTRALPGLITPPEDEREYLSAQREGFCIRPTCVLARTLNEIRDRGDLSDIWHDVHRLKHNSRRVNHPCQLPPLLMRRLMSIFTRRGDLILDCFNGAGTSTLVAVQMGRRYIGIERSRRYHNLAKKRHRLLRQGYDPFEKRKEIPKTKNNHLQRMVPQKYAVTKRDLQLDVKRIYRKLGRVPDVHDVARHSDYPIKYFKKYFTSWAEVCAATRTTGMTRSLRPGKNATV
jgi:DNA modification methylase